MKNKGKRIIRISIYLLYLFVCFAVYDNVFVYHVTFNGNKHEVVNINTKYEDPGIIVKLRGHAINDIKVKNNVNTSKFGKYEVVYSFGNITRKRIVEVKDIQKPAISLVDGTVILDYQEEYKEPGFRAKDNYDGNITDKAITINGINNKELGDYIVKYVVTDSHNNETVVDRKIIVTDKTGPSITFKNGEYTFAIKGKKKDFNDYTAVDNYDGIVTDKVTMSGEVNFNKEGIYTLTYKVKDSHDNETVVTRKVNVQNKNTRGIPVLMYHWFYDDTKGETTKGLANAHNYISKTNITSQAKYLHDNNFYYPTWQELIDYIDGKIDLPEKSVIITDDDCKDSYFEIALPVFQKYEIPSTSFCITSKRNWQKYKKEKYLDFESHTDDLHDRSCDTYWNGAVMCKPYNEIYNDIKLSVQKVGSSYAFAYPFGHYNNNTINALKNNGIKLAFTIRNGRVDVGDDKYLLSRVRMSKDTSLSDFKRYVN